MNILRNISWPSALRFFTKQQVIKKYVIEKGFGKMISEYKYNPKFYFSMTFIATYVLWSKHMVGNEFFRKHHSHGHHCQLDLYKN